MGIEAVILVIFIIFVSEVSSWKTTDDDIGLLFDFIIVGAGSAGSTLAGELHFKKPSWRIAVFEAGTDKLTKNITNFQNSLDLYGSEYDWQDVSEPVKNLNNRVIKLTQGKGCGGTSLLNGMVWFRGNKNDFNDWAVDVNDITWSYKNLLPLMKSIETYPKKSIYRGNNGPVYVNPDLTDTPYNRFIKKEFSKLGYTENNDYNGADEYGVALTQLNVKSNETIGIRQDAFSSYVRPHLPNPNLFIYHDCLVDRIVLNNMKADYLIFKLKNGTFSKAKAKYEIILSAGALRSPTILMRSGIADCNDLKKYNIECELDLKGVGKNLQDHLIPYGLWNFRVRDNNHRTSMDVNVITGSVKSKISGLLKPKFQVQTYYSSFSFGIGISLLHPKSSGTVSIRSKKVDDKPIINLNYLSEKSDLDDLLEGMKIIFKIAEQLQKTYIDNPIVPTIIPTTDEEIKNYIRNITISNYHYAGTCKMGCFEDKYSVVDSKLRVHRVKGLRIADASIMPTITSGNTNAPSMLIGLKCANLLLNEYFYL